MTAVNPPARQRARQVDWRVRLGAPLGFWLIRLLGFTWRMEDAPKWRGAVAAARPTMFLLWHGHLLPLAYTMRHLGVFVLSSEHRDAEIVVRIINRLGFLSLRGSSSRNATKALVSVIRTLREGQSVAITPDGPRGPALSMTAGPLFAAQKAGVTVTTLFVTADRAWRLKTWDSFMIPKPFARVTVHVGEPFQVPEAANPESYIDEAKRRLAPAGGGA
jgi:lysophospholipid acyltransferase (LPLAT)-like uncharacterized protein